MIRPPPKSTLFPYPTLFRPPRASPRLPGVPQASARLRAAAGREVPRVRQHVHRGLEGPRLKRRENAATGVIRRSEERRVGKSVDLGGRRIIKKKKRINKKRL